MKRLSIILTLAVCLLASGSMHAQTNMIIHLNDGSDIVIPVADIDSLTFTFENLSDLPNIATTSVEDIGSEGAICGGEIIDEGSSPVTQKGICWSTSPNPNTSDAYTEEGPGGGIFSSEMSGLAVNTGYFVRAYATNSYGTAYGGTQVFATIDPEEFASMELGLVGDGLNYNGAQHNWNETIYLTLPTIEETLYTWTWNGVETNLSGTGFKFREGQEWSGYVVGSNDVDVTGSAAGEIAGGGGSDENDFVPLVDLGLYNFTLVIDIATGAQALIVEPG